MTIWMAMLATAHGNELCEPSALEAYSAAEAAYFDAKGLPGMKSQLTLRTDTTSGRLAVGNGVRARGDAGNVLPIHSGHPKSVVIGPQVGRVECFVDFARRGYRTVQAVVTYEPTTWHEHRSRFEQMKEGRPYSGDELRAMDVRGEPVELGRIQVLVPVENLAPVRNGP